LSPKKQFPGAKSSGDADLARLLDIIGAFSRQSIVVLGDFVADEFVAGEISRVSREAPVLILRHHSTELVPGGGANAANNLVDLGAKIFPVGAIGDDASGQALLDYFQNKGVDTSGIVRAPGWTTTTKTRFLAGFTHTNRQQVLRVDREPDAPLPADALAKLSAKARALSRRASAVLVSDYGCGSVTPALVRRLGAKLITLDSRFSLFEYSKSKITAATPNEPELESLFHTRIGTDTRKLDQLAARALRTLGSQALVVTRGKDGMVVYERGRQPHYIPVYGTDQCADVTGAGDTVIATFTLAVSAGATFVEAAHIATYAAGIVVMKRGTATVTRAELESALRRDAGSR